VAPVAKLVVVGHNSDADTSFVVKIDLVVDNFVKEGLEVGTEHCTEIAQVTSWESYKNLLDEGGFHVDVASCRAEPTCDS